MVVWIYLVRCSVGLMVTDPSCRRWPQPAVVDARRPSVSRSASHDIHNARHLQITDLASSAMPPLSNSTSACVSSVPGRIRRCSDTTLQLPCPPSRSEHQFKSSCTRVAESGLKESHEFENRPSSVQCIQTHRCPTFLSYRPPLIHQ